MERNVNSLIVVIGYVKPTSSVSGERTKMASGTNAVLPDIDSIKTVRS